MEREVAPIRVTDKIMETKTKEQAREELLEAIDVYIDVVMAEREKEKQSRRMERMEKYVEEHKNDSICIPEDSRGPYAQCLRRELEI